MARLRALGSIGGFHALSCYLSLIFMQSESKWDQNKTYCSRSIFRGGGGAPAAPPLDPPLFIRVAWSLSLKNFELHARGACALRAHNLLHPPTIWKSLIRPCTFQAMHHSKNAPFSPSTYWNSFMDILLHTHFITKEINCLLPSYFRFYW